MALLFIPSNWFYTHAYPLGYSDWTISFPLSDVTTSKINPDKKFTLKQESFVSKRVARIKRLQARFDLDYLIKDSLVLIKECISGILRVKNIVRDLKAFVHPGQEYPEFIDIHKH